MRRYLKIILGIILFTLITIYIFDENSNDSDTYSYKVSDCNNELKMFEYSGINKLEWINESNLYIKATTSINCAREIQKAYVKIHNNEIYLSYIIDNSDRYAQCSCGRTIEFEIKNLTKNQEYIIKFKENKKEHFAKINLNETYGLNLIPHISNLKILEFENKTFDENNLSYDDNGINTENKNYNWVNNSTLNITAQFELNCNEKLERVEAEFQNHYKQGNIIFVKGYYSPENNIRTNFNAASGIKGSCRKIVEVNFLYNDFEKKDFGKIISWANDIETNYLEIFK